MKSKRRFEVMAADANPMFEGELHDMAENVRKLYGDGYRYHEGFSIGESSYAVFAYAGEIPAVVTESPAPTLIDVTQDIAGIWIRLTDSACATVSLFIPNTMTIEQHIKSTMYAAQAAYVRGHHDCRDGKTNLIAGFEDYWDKWGIRMLADHDTANYTATQMEVGVEGAAQIAPVSTTENNSTAELISLALMRHYIIGIILRLGFFQVGRPDSFDIIRLKSLFYTPAALRQFELHVNALIRFSFNEEDWYQCDTIADVVKLAHAIHHKFKTHVDHNYTTTMKTT